MTALSDPGTTPASIPQQRRHLFAEKIDLLVRLAQIRQQPQIVAGDGAAAEEPRPDAEEFVELHQFAVADKNPILADERLHQSLKLAEHFRREEQRPIGD